MKLVRVLALAVVVAAITATPAAGQAGQAIDKPATTFYFAEGTVRPGFVTMLVLENLATVPANIEVRFAAVDASGQKVDVKPLTFSVDPLGRTSRNIADHVSAQGGDVADLSMEVRSDRDVAAERTLYFRTNLAGGASGVTSGIGTTQTARKWYFPEGPIADGFEESLVFFNPGTTNSRVTVKFTTAVSAIPGQEQKLDNLTLEVPPNGRTARNIKDFLRNIGAKVPLDVSASVEGTEPIVVERVLYFKTDRAGGASGGTIVAGATAGAGKWYFAEGSSKVGPAQSLTVMNVSDKEASLKILLRAFDTADKNKKVTTKPLEEILPPHGRKSYDMADVMKTKGLINNFDVSIEVEANRNVVVERTVFFHTDAAGGVSGGYSVFGTSLPSRKLAFPAGRVANDADTEFTFLNPGTSKAKVTLQFAAVDGSGKAVPIPEAKIDIDSDSRAERNLKDLLPAGASTPLDVSVRVEANVPVIAERIHYVNSSLAGGVSGGSLVPGYVGKGEGQNVPFGLAVIGVVIMVLAIGTVAVGFSRQKQVEVPVEEPPAAA
jgi:hypothetical protein